MESLKPELLQIIVSDLPYIDLRNLMCTSKTMYKFIKNNDELKVLKISEFCSSSSNQKCPRMMIFDFDKPWYEQLDTIALGKFNGLEELIFEGNRLWYEIPKNLIKLLEDVTMLTMCVKTEIPEIKRNDSCFPRLRTLNILNNANQEGISFFPEAEEVNMYDGATFSFDPPFNSTPNIRRLIIYRAALPIIFYDTCWIANFKHLQDLTHLTLQDCLIGVSFEFYSLKLLKLVNCTFTEGIFSLVPEFCEIEEFHIEDCKDCTWMIEFLDSDCRVSDLKLIKLDLPKVCQELLRNFNVVKTLTRTNVRFIDEPESTL